MPEQQSFKFTAYITTDTLAHAQQVASERINYDETYIDENNERFDYALSSGEVETNPARYLTPAQDTEAKQEKARAIARDLFAEADPKGWSSISDADMLDALTEAAFQGLTA